MQRRLNTSACTSRASFFVKSILIVDDLEYEPGLVVPRSHLVLHRRQMSTAGQVKLCLIDCRTIYSQQYTTASHNVTFNMAISLVPKLTHTCLCRRFKLRGVDRPHFGTLQLSSLPCACFTRGTLEKSGAIPDRSISTPAWLTTCCLSRCLIQSVCHKDDGREAGNP